MKIKRFEETVICKLLNYIQDLEDLIEQYEECYGKPLSNVEFVKKYGYVKPLTLSNIEFNPRYKCNFGDEKNEK